MRPLLSLAILGAALSSASAINFTPRPEKQVIDTYEIHFVSFEDDGQRIGYGPPTGWKCLGSGGKLTLEDPENRQALTTLTTSSVAKPGPLTPDRLASCKALALALVPAEGESVTLAEATGQHPIGNREAYTANITYAFYGQKFCIRVVFVNLDKSILQITTTAPQNQFATFAETLEKSFFSWHWMTPK